MIDEKITSNEFDELFRGQMITDRGKSDPRRNSAGSTQGTEEGSFGDAKSPSSAEDITRPIMFGPVKRRIRVVANTISNGHINPDGLIDSIRALSDDSARIRANARMVTINDVGWGEIGR